MSRGLFIAAALAAVAPVAAQIAPTPPSPAIRAAVDAPARPAAERARDPYRHPAETLAFFGVAPGQAVVELFPSGGWFTHILLPLIGPKGRYVAVVPDNPKAIASAEALVAGGAPGARTVVAFGLATPFAQPGSADRVLTFRNVHNLLMSKGDGPDGVAPAFFAAAFAALKPGGVLGIEEHRLPEAMDAAREKTSGYVKKSTVVRLATAAGFRLAGESAVNANPKDTHDWPEGVWTLPPTYQLGDKDRAKYQAIGESDRMTLRFVKPR